MTRYIKQLLDPAAGGGAGGGGAPVDWKTGLPPELAANPVLTAFKDPIELAKSWDNAQKLIGTKRIALPGEKATDQERDEFYKALGRPETVDKYTDGTIKPDKDIVIDSESLTKAKAQFFKLGLTDAQQKGIMDFYLGGINESQKKLSTEMTASRATSEEALRKEWGDKYNANFGVIKNVLAHFGDEATATELQGHLGNNVGLVKLLYKFGTTLAEDKSLNNKFPIPVNTPAAAQQRILELRSDVTFQKALNDQTDPGHKQAVELWTQVHRQLG